MDTAPVVFDRSAALERVGGDVALLREIAALFLDELPALRGRIGDSVRDRDARTLEEAAHCLKGSVGNFGLNAAFQAAFDLEVLARSQALDGIEERHARLESALDALVLALADVAGEPES